MKTIEPRAPRGKTRVSVNANYPEQQEPLIKIVAGKVKLIVEETAVHIKAAKEKY